MASDRVYDFDQLGSYNAESGSAPSSQHSHIAAQEFPQITHPIAASPYRCSRFPR